jgi:hypothetical protein
MFRQFCHHQGATYCLAKITICIIVRAMRSLYYGYVAKCQWKECFLESLVSCVVWISLILNFKYFVEMNAPNQEFLHKKNTWVLRHSVNSQSFSISIIPVSFWFFGSVWQCFGRVLGTIKQLRTSFLSIE